MSARVNWWRVVGPNGAGKTTLLFDPRRGAATDRRTVIGALLRAGKDQRIGWAPQEPALYSKLTVEENLRLFARSSG